jgi:AraC family transcriptional activator of mtrCDE
MDWLSHFLGMTPVSGRLEIRCQYGAPWRVSYDESASGEMPYHVIVSGSGLLESQSGDPPQPVTAGDIVVLAHGSAHVVHDGSGSRPKRSIDREALNLVMSENSGKGSAFEMLCGRFLVKPPYNRLIRAYLPSTLVVHAGDPEAAGEPNGTASHLAGLVNLMRTESAVDRLGGTAMLNAFSTALFALTLRLAGESNETPFGLMGLAGSPRLAPALTAMLNEPARAWTLPDLAALCNMSRATLARHFQDHVGASANALLTDIRMNLALGELSKPSMSTALVADTVGYQSVSAFKRVFKQRMGMTPAEWKRTPK